MIGPAEIEDMRLDQADAENAKPHDEDATRARRWGIATTEPAEVVQSSGGLTDRRPAASSPSL